MKWISRQASNLKMGVRIPPEVQTNMKDSAKIIAWVIAFVVGATLIVYGTSIWSFIEKQFNRPEVNEDVRVKGPTGPPYVKGPTGPPPE